MSPIVLLFTEQRGVRKGLISLQWIVDVQSWELRGPMGPRGAPQGPGWWWLGWLLLNYPGMPPTPQAGPNPVDQDPVDHRAQHPGPVD